MFAPQIKALVLMTDTVILPISYLTLLMSGSVGKSNINPLKLLKL